jgi:hypothetical protein
MIANRIAKLAIVTAAVGAPLLSAGAAFAASPVHTNVIHPDGFGVVQGCSSFNGTITYTPGLRTAKARAVHAVVSGTLSNCFNLNGPLAGTGNIIGTLSGTSSLNAINLTGTLAVNWPGSTNTVAVRLSGANQGVDTVQGTIQSGPYTTGAFQTSLLAVAHTGTGTSKKPVTSQTVVNTSGVNDLFNFG